MSAQVQSSQVPDHVPFELVLDYALAQGRRTTDNGFEDILPTVHAERPEIFYSLDAYPGFGPAWIIRRAEDLRRIYLDTEHFSSHGLAPFAALLQESWSMVPLESDPPMHGHYRTMMNPLFMPKAIKKLEGKIRSYAEKYISRFQDRGECEFMKEFAFEYPITVVLELMGLPQEMVGQFLEWEHGLLHEAEAPKIAAAARNVVDYLRSVLRDRRANPTEDVLSYAIAAEIDGRAMSDDELLGFALTLYAGGLDTVSTTLGNFFRHLADHPDLQRRLRRDPSLIPAAAEELLRAYSPSTTFRICIKQTEIRGVKIMPGDKVAMATGLGNRDPQEYDRPGEIILDRKANHLGFGYGIHRCIGVHLARMELTYALEEFLGRIPEFRMKPGAKILTNLANVIQIDRLPLIWDGREARDQRSSPSQRPQE